MNLTTSVAGNRLTIRLEGRFDFSAHRAFREAIKAAVANKDIKEVVLDMMKAEYIDSSALGMLLLSRENCTGAGKAIRIANPRGTVKEVLHIASFEKLFTIE
ncbi:STAS-domain containing protein [Rhodocyclaceae bacterium]|nr:STAS-domain containing protein [Rhodocyclaceae bacterium]